MSKFKVKMKITGFELDIEGTREDMPIITQNLARQLGGMMGPATDIIEGNIAEEQTRSPLPLFDVIENPSQQRKPRKKRAPSNTKSESTDKITALDLKPEHSKFSTPKQSWTAMQKAMWTLYVAGETLGVTELPSNVITETFNKYFKQAGVIKTFNITRDFGKSKSKGWLGENVTKNPSHWYLLEEGIKVVQTHIASQAAQQ